MEAKGRWLRTRQNSESIALYMAGPDAVGAPLSIPPELFTSTAAVTAVDLDSGFKFPAEELRPVAEGLYFLRGR